MVTGLFAAGTEPRHLHYDARSRELMRANPAHNAACLDCGCGHKSRLAWGDRARLPCRMPSSNG